jgi:DNA-binding winged helix-turn-helix (wHTH) protein
VLESALRQLVMPSSSQQVRVICFGMYELDLAARELRRDGARVKLQDRPFDVLVILIERAGEVVSREEFRQRLWPADTFVDFDPSLNTSINKLRQALSDDADNPRFIATAGRRGYRFIAPITVVGAPLETGELPITRGTAGERRRVPKLWIAGVLAMVGILVSAAIVVSRLPPERDPKVLNVAQISHDGHIDPWGRLTTDGARLLFLDREGGHWNLMQVPASGGESRPFPEPSQNVRIVDISPDRSEFLTFSFPSRRGDLPLSLTPVVGGAPRRVGNIIADDAAFAPDGRRIVFTRPDGIYSCERDGSLVEKIISLPGRPRAI